MLSRGRRFVNSAAKFVIAIMYCLLLLVYQVFLLQLVLRKKLVVATQFVFKKISLWRVFTSVFSHLFQRSRYSDIQVVSITQEDELFLCNSKSHLFVASFPTSTIKFAVNSPDFHRKAPQHLAIVVKSAEIYSLPHFARKFAEILLYCLLCENISYVTLYESSGRLKAQSAELQNLLSDTVSFVQRSKCGLFLEISKIDHNFANTNSGDWNASFFPLEKDEEPISKLQVSLHWRILDANDGHSDLMRVLERYSANLTEKELCTNGMDDSNLSRTPTTADISQPEIYGQLVCGGKWPATSCIVILRTSPLEMIESFLHLILFKLRTLLGCEKRCDNLYFPEMQTYCTSDVRNDPSMQIFKPCFVYKPDSVTFRTSILNNIKRLCNVAVTTISELANAVKETVIELKVFHYLNQLLPNSFSKNFVNKNPRNEVQGSYNCTGKMGSCREDSYKVVQHEVKECARMNEAAANSESGNMTIDNSLAYKIVEIRKHFFVISKNSPVRSNYLPSYFTTDDRNLLNGAQRMHICDYISLIFKNLLEYVGNKMAMHTVIYQFGCEGIPPWMLAEAELYQEWGVCSSRLKHALHLFSQTTQRFGK